MGQAFGAVTGQEFGAVFAVLPFFSFSSSGILFLLFVLEGTGQYDLTANTSHVATGLLTARCNNGGTLVQYPGARTEQG